MADTALNKFIRASDAVFAFQANFDSISEDTHTVYTLKVHGGELKLVWEKVRATHDNCLIYLNTSDKVEPGDAEVASEKYYATYNTYAACLGVIQEKLANLTSAQKSCNLPEINPCKKEDAGHNLTLPPCDIDTFEGNYLTWPTFRDIFTALYIKSARLSNIERLCHLIRNTSGEAKEIVSRFPLCDEGFEMAWNSLKAAYENPRMLVNNQLKLLFNLPSLDEETSVGLKSLQRGINSCLFSLSLYNIPTVGWDPIIVFMCIQRLPSSTVFLWEQNIKDKSAHPLWKDLDSFLTERVQTLDCVSGLKDLNFTANKNKTKVLAHSTSIRNPCILCANQYHYLRDCSHFQNLSTSERISTINTHKCCFNCLSTTHLLHNCRSNNNCLICDNRHHTLLHQDSNMFVTSANHCPASDSSAHNQTHSNNQNSTSAVSRPSNNVQNSQRPLSSADIYSNQRVFHARQNKSVLLGTATVDLLHKGNRYKVRALIDSASECSFISDKLRKRFKLPSESTTSNVSGVNDTVSATSKRLCSVTIGSEVDLSVKVKTLAFVLPKISGDLPSVTVNSEIKNVLPNLRLADSNPFESRPVEMLIGADLYPQIMMPDIKRDVLGSLLAQKTVFGWILTGPVNST